MVFSIAVETVGVGGTSALLDPQQSLAVALEILDIIIMSQILQKCKKNRKFIVVVYMLSVLVHHYTWVVYLYI